MRAHRPGHGPSAEAALRRERHGPKMQPELNGCYASSFINESPEFIDGKSFRNAHFRTIGPLGGSLPVVGMVIMLMNVNLDLIAHLSEQFGTSLPA